MEPQPKKQTTTTQQVPLLFGSNVPQLDTPLELIPKIVQHQNIYLAQRKIMLDKYRRYVQDYSKACPQLNQKVLEYNKTVIAHVAQTNNQEWAKLETAQLKEALGKCSIMEYNNAVKKRNKEIGQPLIMQKKHMPIRKNTEHIFSVILFKYAMQIDEKNKILSGCGATTTRAIQKIKVNHYELANTIIDGVNTLPYNKRTIHNHINRLVEAGVLFDYDFKGREKPVEYHLTSQILTLFDQKTRKTLCAENQLFKWGFEKNLHNNVIVTRTNKDNNNVIEPVNKQSRIKEIETPSSLLSKMQLSVPDNDQNTYRNTTQRKQFEHAPAGRTGAGAENLMAFLLSFIVDRQILIEKYSAGDYQKWRFYRRGANKPSLEILENEVKHGIMSPEDFLELLTQLAFKYSGNIYRKRNQNGEFPYPGNAYHGYVEIKDLLLNQNGTIPTKETQLRYFKGIMWRLKVAANSFNSSKKSLNPPFPKQYFDPTRKTSNDVSFAYTQKMYNEHFSLETHNQKKKHRRQKQLEAAQVRSARQKTMAAIQKKSKQVVQSKMSVNQYLDYVQNNAHIKPDMKVYAINLLEKAFKCW